MQEKIEVIGNLQFAGKLYSANAHPMIDEADTDRSVNVLVLDADGDWYIAYVYYYDDPEGEWLDWTNEPMLFGTKGWTYLPTVLSQTSGIGGGDV